MLSTVSPFRRTFMNWLAPSPSIAGFCRRSSVVIVVFPRRALASMAQHRLLSRFRPKYSPSRFDQPGRDAHKASHAASPIRLLYNFNSLSCINRSNAEGKYRSLCVPIMLPDRFSLSTFDPASVDAKSANFLPSIDKFVIFNECSFCRNDGMDL